MGGEAMRRLSTFGAMVIAALGAIGVARADEVEDFYRGRTISIVVATSSGGAYDILARVLAQHLGRHLPGKPSLVVRNMPGGGGIAGANWLYNVAPKDGTVIGALLNIGPFEPAFGTAGVLYDPTKFTWLGSSDPETGFLALWHTVPVNSIEELRTKEVTVGTSGPASSPSFFARLEMEVLKSRLKIIPGYPGQNEAFLAIERGELDGYPSVFYSSLTAFKPDWVRDRKIKLLVQFGSKIRPEFPDVPSMMDIVKDPADRLLAEAAFALTDIGRPYILPPGVPAPRADAIKAAMRATFADPAFLADARAAGLQVDAPQDAAAVQSIIDRVYRMPAKVIERLRQLKVVHGD
jgi:tripartite-type tricarboxylate transporter receptor subunit TctC